MSMYEYALTPSAKDGSQTISNDSFSDQIFLPPQGSSPNQQENISKKKPSRLMKGQLLVL